jgi:hypothetical protein
MTERTTTMTNGDEIIICKVGNGYVVTPREDIRNGNTRPNTDVLVFQRLGTAGDSYYPDSLMTWLESHFGIPAGKQ